MKKSFISFMVSACMLLGSATGLAACSNEHDHVWNDGEITTPSTCSVAGVKTFKCTVKGCEETKTEPVEKAAHAWDNGEVTEEPSCKKAGVKTFTCTECDETKTEPVGKTDHDWDDGVLTVIPDLDKKGEITYTCSVCDEKDRQPVAARADFEEQFTKVLPAGYGWAYGSASGFDASTGEMTFNRLDRTDEEEPDLWKAEGVAIGAGRVHSEANAVIAYTVAIGTDISYSLAFVGDEETTRVNAYLAVNGEIFTLSEDSKDWTFTSDDEITVSAGDILYFIFDNAGEGAPDGSLKITLTAACVHDFAGEWVNTSPDGHYHECANCGANDTVIAHTMEDVEVIDPATPESTGLMKTRCEVCGYEGTREIPVDNHVAGAEYVSDDTHHWKECTAHDDCGAQLEKAEHGWVLKATTAPTLTTDGSREYECEVCRKTKSETITAREDFRLSFNAENQDGAWVYGTADYQFEPSETFTFTAATEKNSNNDGWKSGNNEIKADWINSNGNVALGYKVGAGVTKIHFNFSYVGGGEDPGRFDVRIWRTKDDATVGNGMFFGKNAEGGRVDENGEIETSEGEIIYLIFFHEDGWEQVADFNYVLTDATPKAD